MELEIAVVDLQSIIVYVQDNDSYVLDFFQLEREGPVHQFNSSYISMKLLIGNVMVDRKSHGW